MIPERVWRTLPWDPLAREGEPFSASYVPAAQGAGRFDLPGRSSGVIYTAETPEHAIAERIQHYRGHTLENSDLVVADRRLALTAAAVPPALRDLIADLCDPRTLVRLRVHPDATASRHRRTTQHIAGVVHARAHTGLRWWSSFSGDWHAVVIFRDRLAAPLAWSAPKPISLTDERLREAASLLGLVVSSRA